MDKRDFHYRGDLRQTTLPEMLFSIHHYGVPGVVEAHQKDVIKKIFVRAGNVIYASSTDRKDSLGAHLLRLGLVPEPALKQAMSDRTQSEKRLGGLLIERNLLSPAAVHLSVREQVEGILWGLFGWEEGEVLFKINEWDDSGMIRTLLPMRRVILQGIKKAPSARTLLHRVGPKETVLEPSYRVEELIEVGLDGPEYKLLTMINGRRTLYDVCTAGPFAPAENAKLVYAYLVLQLVRHSDTGGAIKIRLKAEAEVAKR